jgi:serine phosphatase RsbU (regulator of sigma subunit)
VHQSLELNDLVGMLRGWLDEAQLSVPRLHQRLTADHFASQQVPELRRLRDHLAGDGLTWDLVEAVADLCFPGDGSEKAQLRLARPKELWEASKTAPTLVRGEGPEVAAPAAELLHAHERTIQVYEELTRTRRAYEVSEQGRQQALRMATLLYATLGQAQSKVALLTRQLEMLPTRSDVPSAELAGNRYEVQRASSQEKDLYQQLARAEQDRQTAQTVADHAARRIQQLEVELRRLKAGTVADDQASAPEAAPALPSSSQADSQGDDASLDLVDQALDTARQVLDREHQSVQQAAEDIGFNVTLPYRPEPDPTIVRGHVLTHDRSPRSAPGTSVEGRADCSPKVSRTTPNNPDLADHRPTLPAMAHGLPAGQARVLAAAERIAAGTSLEEVLSAFHDSIVPEFADTLLIYLREPQPDYENTPPPTHTLSPALTLESAARPRSLTRTPTPLVEVPGGSAFNAVLAGSPPGLISGTLSPTALRGLTGSSPLSAGGAILVPLRGKRQLAGVALLMRQPQRSAYEEADVLMAAQMAKHAALGLDRALLYHSQAFFADELQRTMLPEQLLQPTGCHLASRYLPAAKAAQRGGDWYDSIQLPGHRAGLVVGDVMAHHMTSAAVMGQLRITAQTLASLDLPPQEVLRHLDEQAQRLGSDRIATCLYAVYNPHAHRLIIANAGHPPPVLLHRDGRTEVLRVPAGAPIGAGVDFKAVELDAPTDATLLLYTDGLVKSRQRDAWTGIEHLREKLTAAARLSRLKPPPLEWLCDEVLDTLRPPGRDDDIALLAARFDGIAPSDVTYQSLIPEDQEVGRAHRL